MTLEFNQISNQVKALGESSAQAAQLRRTKAEQAKALLQTFSESFDELMARVHKAEQVQEAVRFSWLGAAPADEPLAVYHPEPAAAKQVTIIASDGSQIYPDRHAIALYYLVNIGVIIYRQGSGQSPEVRSVPTLFYEPQDLEDDQGFLTPAGIVNVKRDLGEIKILADLAEHCQPEGHPLISLIDGRLTLRTIDLPGREQTRAEQTYLDYLTQIRQAGATIAAFIDKPHSSFLISLLHLASLEIDKISEETLRQNPFSGVIDSDLFDDLLPGQRSAIFNQRAKANIVYDRQGHRIDFFYLNTGTPGNPNLVRVEIPHWVAQDQERLDLLHTTLLSQARMTVGYPYVLARAHELAIISPKEREALETMLSVSLLRNDQTAAVSRKQHNKNLLSGQEPFRL
jgi:hypothetical protein